MSENVYAPPAADLGSGFPDPSPSSGSGTFTLGRCFSEAWERTWDNFPLWLGAGVVFLLVLTLSGFTILGIPLVWPVLFWGGYVFFLHMHDRHATLSDLFSGFRRYSAALGGMIGFFLLLVVLGVPSNVLVQIGMKNQPPSFALVGVGYLLSIAIALFVTARFQFAPFLIVERRLGLGEALAKSWSSTAEQKLGVALLTIAPFPLAIVGTLALIVGIFPAMVLSYLLWVSAYRQMFGGPPATAA